jgi:hypothetical protein
VTSRETLRQAFGALGSGSGRLALTLATEQNRHYRAGEYRNEWPVNPVPSASTARKRGVPLCQAIDRARSQLTGRCE